MCAEATGRELKVVTQYKVRDGYWNLMAIDRKPVGFGVRYVPRYRFLKWDHKRADEIQRATR